MDDNSIIPETFKGKAVLITGGTGFLGKVLLEKLLRSCPGISEVLLLLRPGKTTCEKRFADLQNCEVFNNIRTNNPRVLRKMRFMKGDVTSENLGLERSSLQKIVDDVSFVFHCAATVRFDDPPKKMFNINLKGVLNVLEVCRTMKKLEGFVHVSTAYSFCNQVIISEDIYPEIMSPMNILAALNWMAEDLLEMFSDMVMEGRPTLYHYSKAMAEIYLVENCGNIPTVIVRPSIVTAALNDPFPGWVDNINGPTGLIALSSKGIVRTFLVEKNVNADWVPVDIVVNTLIRAAHVISTERKTGEEILLRSPSSGIPIINCVCPEQNIIQWFDVIQLCIPLIYKYPSKIFYRTPGKGIVTSSLVVLTLYKYFAHYLPAAVIDVLYLPIRREMRWVRGFQRIHGAMSILQHYTTHSFFFTSANMQRLVQQMNPVNSNIFPIDQNQLQWPDYMENYVHGVRKYYLRENDSNLESTRKKLERYVLVSRVLKMTSVVLLLYLLCHRYGNLKERILSSIVYIYRRYLSYFP